MRVIVLFALVIGYLFALVVIESELVRIEVRKEALKDAVIELQNEKERLQSRLIDYCNLARIEAAAKDMGYVFPKTEDILGVIE